MRVGEAMRLGPRQTSFGTLALDDKMSWKKKRDVRLRYDGEANGYDELYSYEQRMKFELALRRMAFSRRDRILDCGCGIGIFLEKVAGSVQFAVGVDLSPKMLERAKLRLGQISNVDLVCADIDFLPFSEGTFRLVFMFTVLLGHTYWGDTISEALRVLRTHGIMTLSVLKKETSRENVLSKLSMNGLEPRELIDDDTALDYVVISEKGPQWTI
jgi:ubiquinone/menaquinone biosynthesis C-methylase UbiE